MSAPGTVITAVLQQGTQVADSLRTDSIAVESPLPSPALHVVRFLFNTVPQWVQIGGVFLAAAVAIVLAILTWRNRIALRTWFGTYAKYLSAPSVDTAKNENIGGTHASMIGIWPVVAVFVAAKKRLPHGT